MTEHKASKRVHVAVGVILDSRGQVLIAKRADQQHLGGLWEFPGGKLEAGESAEQALGRELKEELAIDVQNSYPLCRIEHNYPDKSVLLDVRIVDQFTGTPTGLENQPLRWLPPAQLVAEEFPQANRLIIRRLQLCDMLGIINLPVNTPGPVPKTPTLPCDVLLRLRCRHKDQYAGYLSAARQALPGFAANNRGVILDLSDTSIDDTGCIHAELSDTAGIKGLHAHAGLLQSLTARPVPEHLLFGVSCHTQDDLAQAARIDADYALLSPVKTTTTHPGTVPLGWDAFESMVRRSPVPIYALGGMRAADMATAQARGARGIAGISLLSCDTRR